MDQEEEEKREKKKNEALVTTASTSDECAGKEQGGGVVCQASEQQQDDGDDGKNKNKRPRTEDNNNDTTSKKSNNKKKRMKKKHMDPAVLELRGIIQRCCATNDLATAIEAYDKAIAATDNIRIVEPQSFYNLLNLCDGLPADRGIHIGTPKIQHQYQQQQQQEEGAASQQTPAGSSRNAPYESQTRPQPSDIDLVTRKGHAYRIKKRMDELQIPLSESSYTALIRLLSKCGDVDEAELLLDEAETVQQCRPKLRMYAPLLHRYCDMKNISQALKVWLRASSKGFVLTEKEYAALLQCACNVGNANVMERVLSDLAEDVLVPSKQTCQIIVDWFNSPSAIHIDNNNNMAEKQRSTSTATTTINTGANEIEKLLQQIKVPYPIEVTHDCNMGPVQININMTNDDDDDPSKSTTTTQQKWCIDDGCRIDPKTGVLQSGCLKGSCLKPVTTSQQAWDEMKRLNEQIVIGGKVEGDASEFQGGKKGPKRQLDNKTLEQRKRNWNSFNRYLARRGNKLDVVIDGANVGYFEANFSGAPKHVDYAKIDWIVQHFLSMNQSVLLILHSRHFSNRMMPKHMQHYERSWRQADVLYSTPGGMNDDWFWLHAALVSGPGTLILTNDEMRDHHFQMLAPRSFLRWKDRHQIHFEFGTWVEEDDDNTNDIGGTAGAQRRQQNQQQRKRRKRQRRRKVLLRYPEPYSRRIQRVEPDGLVVPLPKLGDSNRFLDGSHEATANDGVPVDETYLCIRPITT